MKELLLITCILMPGVCFAQQFSIPWYKISGGGGSASNGQFSLSGTIGQVDAGGTLTGGGFSVIGGYWSIVTACTNPPVPANLSIQVTSPGTAIISWPASQPGFVLQRSATLAVSAWTPVTAPISVVKGSNQVTVATQVGNNFFRLAAP